MQAFDFEINVSPERSDLSNDGNLLIQGVVRHSHGSYVEVGNSAGGSRLKLGYRIYSDLLVTEMLFEDRAQCDQALLEPARLYSFRIEIPAKFRGIDQWFLFLDFVYEDEYWFSERGRKPFICRMNRETVSSAIPSSQDPRNVGALSSHESRESISEVISLGQEERYAKSAPNLLSAVADAIQAVADRYGFRLSVEFAYLFLLGRRADPQALSEKSLALSTKRVSLNEICAQMLASEEYQGRQISQHRDPKVVIQSWATIDEQ